MTVVKAGGIPKFAALLKSPDCNVREQCVWALGNIAGDGPHLRDAVIEAGAIDSLIALVRPDTKVSICTNSVIECVIMYLRLSRVVCSYVC